MSFQAYLDTIKKKTGKSPADFKKLATEKGFLKKGKLAEGVKAGDIFKWVKEDFDLGQGHGMACLPCLKGQRKRVIKFILTTAGF